MFSDKYLHNRFPSRSRKSFVHSALYFVFLSAFIWTVIYFNSEICDYFGCWWAFSLFWVCNCFEYCVQSVAWEWCFEESTLCSTEFRAGSLLLWIESTVSSLMICWVWSGKGEFLVKNVFKDVISTLQEIWHKIVGVV